MKYYSEKLNKFYETEKDCSIAEAKADAEKERAKIESAKKDKERKADAKVVEEAYNTLVKDAKQYQKVLSDFIEKHGSYHMSISTNNYPFDTLFSNLFDIFFRF